MKDIHQLARFGSGRQVFDLARKDPKALARLNRRGQTPLEAALESGNRDAVNIIRGLLFIKAKKEAA